MTALAKWFDIEKEFKCRCGRPDCEAPTAPHRLLVLYLDRAREMYGKPILVTSGNRCQFWNAEKKGETPSEHVQPDGCLGADLACSTSRARALLLDAIRHAGITRVVLYPKHIHVGVGDAVQPDAFPPNVVALGRA